MKNDSTGPRPPSPSGISLSGAIPGPSAFDLAQSIVIDNMVRAQTLISQPRAWETDDVSTRSWERVDFLVENTLRLCEELRKGEKADLGTLEFLGKRAIGSKDE